MPDQLLQRQRNRVLSELMSEYGLSRASLAEAVNASIAERTGAPGNCDKRLVGRWLAGEVVWPRPASRHALEEVFGRRADALGFRPPGSASAWVTVRTRNPHRRTPQELPMERRTFAIGLGLGLALPALPEAGRLGMSDIARIRSAEERLSNADDLQGGARLVDGADRYVRYVEQAVRRCTVSSRVQVALHQSLGEMYANIGWLHYDASRYETARQRWDTALRYAVLARDPMLQARAWAGVARQAADLGHGSEAVAVARAALDATRGRRNPRLSALLHTRVALGHAVEGTPGRCAQSLSRAEQELDRADRRDAPKWLAFCGPDEIASQVAISHYVLGDYRTAAQAERQALAIRTSGYQRNHFAGCVSLARSALAAGEADEALAAAGQAVELLPEVSSRRWAAHLDQFARDVHQGAPEQAGDFTVRYRAARAVAV